MSKAKLSPDAWVKGGGGRPDDVDAKILRARFEKTDYDGGIDDEIIALALYLEIDGEELERPQWLSCGSKAGTPAAKGKSLDCDEDEGIADGSNCALFLGSLFEAGMPTDAIEEDISVLDGIVVHLVQKPITRKGLARTGDNDRGGKQTVTVVDHIVSSPWTKGKKSKAGKASKVSKKDEDEDDEEDEDEAPARSKKGKGKPVKGKKSKADDEEEEEEDEDEDADEDSDDEDDDEAEESDEDDALVESSQIVLKTALSLARDGKILRAKLPAAIYQAIAKKHKKFEKQKAAILKVVTDPKFLKTEEGWSYDGKAVSAEE